MSVRLHFLFSMLAAALIPQLGGAQELPAETRREIGKFLDAIARKEISIGRITIDSVAIESNTLQLFANMNCSYIPFREANVAEIYQGISALLPSGFTKYKLQLRTNKHSIEELIPQALRSKKDKKSLTFSQNVEKPLVSKVSRPYTPANGLQNRHIALWQSHGFYYEPKLNRWEWQRARCLQTVEDLYTQSFVLPYLIPMLENAGANVLIPRERDCQTAEIIIDNDGCLNTRSAYVENTADKAWMQGNGKGFAHLRSQYTDFENPFKEGTFRSIETIKKGKESIAEWIPEIPQNGQYAVYVSYQTVPNSSDDALYTVYHKGGISQFKVNQKMGGGTWIYLGTFGFDAGKNNTCKVTLSNRSAKAGQIVTADAVKIGGGMGNIARRISEEGATDNLKSSDKTVNSSNATGNTTATHQSAYVTEYQKSGYPRFCEAARYWMQWAGIPDSVYSESHGKNDYTDDYKSRGIWVNYLAGGSAANPTEKGLNIPIDMAFAFHSDAGTTLNDSVIGTLGIYQTDAYNGVFANGASRYLSHDLTDLIQSNIVRDIRTLYEPRWTRRGKWNQSYYEARVPRVPTMLLELLSHQNFADMQLGHDPNFKFTVGRAIYKGILQFITSQHDKDYVVQPLPVSNFAIRFGKKKNTLELSWKGEDDPQEPSARPREYIVYTRIGYGGFDNGTLVSKSSYTVKIEPGLVYSFKVTAANRGGESFPSEILSAYKAKHEREKVLIINGFDRISGPAVINTPDKAGFDLEQDPGVPYLSNFSFCGVQSGFDRTQAGKEGKGSLGHSSSELEGMKIAGNTFDYPFIHGKAIQATGKYSFVSCSDEAVENGIVTLEDYPIVDYILGLEKEDASAKAYYKTFSSAMQRIISSYCQSGGNILVSGAYVGSDMNGTQGNREFTQRVLKYGYQGSLTDKNSNRINGLGHTISIPRLPNENNYAIPAPDCIVPVDSAFPVFTYAPGNQSAGIAYKGNYRTFVLGFPFESILSEADRAIVMAGILGFFTQK